MAHSFDERVAYAIDNLWLHIHSGKGAEAKEKLEEAVRDGDADACYFFRTLLCRERFYQPGARLAGGCCSGKEIF